MDEENKDVVGSIMQTYLQGVYHLLELTQPDLAPDWVQEQAVESTPRPTISSRAQFAVVCHALVLFAQAVLRDIRHWVAKQLLTWALRQLFHGMSPMPLPLRSTMGLGPFRPQAASPSAPLTRRLTL